MRLCVFYGGGRIAAFGGWPGRGFPEESGGGDPLAEDVDPVERGDGRIKSRCRPRGLLGRSLRRTTKQWAMWRKSRKSFRCEVGTFNSAVIEK